MIGPALIQIIAVDPGPEKSALVIWAGDECRLATLLPNREMLDALRSYSLWENATLAIEMVACYGMAVGADVFDTCRWIGRFEERWGSPVKLVYRKDVKMHLCGTMKAKDTNIRQALIDKHGHPGNKNAPGKLYGVSGHCWAALAVADYTLEWLNGGAK